MWAVRLHEYGGKDAVKVDEVAPPAPGPGEVLVRVRAAGVNPVDWKIREGQRRERMPLLLPVVLGCDLSGTVEATGAGVSGLHAGDAVFGSTGLHGAFAELVVVKGDQVVRVPPGLDHVKAGAVPLAALTAWQALHLGGVAPGQRVLVHAASGGVGGFAVPLARALGAAVTGTASAANLSYVRQLGATALDYRSDRFEDAEPFDLVLDLVGGDTQDRSWAVLAPGGVLVSSIAVPAPDDPKLAGRRAVRVGVRPVGADLAEVARLIGTGQVPVHVAATLPFTEAAEALERVRIGLGAPGKLVLVAP